MQVSRFLHVANGTSTTRTIEAAEIPGRCSIWADPLYEGPVPARLTDAELIEVRAAFLAGYRDLAEQAASPDARAFRPNRGLHEWRAAIEGDETSYDEIVLWFEHDLFDQLNLVQLLSWLRERSRPARGASLVCIDSFPGRPQFKGLGELTPSELRPLFDTRQPVGPGEYDLAQRAWDAFREPTPTALDELRRADTGALPFLGPALARFLEEYPWTRDGLSRSERRLLELAEGAGIALRQAFPRMHEGERWYYITDLSLAALGTELASTSPPLLTLDHASAAGGPLDAVLRLTEAGRSVLSASMDRISACGIDRWLGGVHLQPRGTIWRWDETSGCIIRAG
jgi:hypothetical protein